MMSRRLILMLAAATLAALPSGCALAAKKEGRASKSIEARVYSLKTGAVIYLPNSTLAVNRETGEVLLQNGYVRLESKGRERPETIKLKTYGTVVETRGTGEVMAIPGRQVRASCLRGTVRLRFSRGKHEARTLKTGQVATIQLKNPNLETKRS